MKHEDSDCGRLDYHGSDHREYVEEAGPRNLGCGQRQGSDGQARGQCARSDHHRLEYAGDGRSPVRRDGKVAAIDREDADSHDRHCGRERRYVSSPAGRSERLPDQAVHAARSEGEDREPSPGFQVISK